MLAIITKEDYEKGKTTWTAKLAAARASGDKKLEALSLSYLESLDMAWKDTVSNLNPDSDDMEDDGDVQVDREKPIF